VSGPRLIPARWGFLGGAADLVAHPAVTCAAAAAIEVEAGEFSGLARIGALASATWDVMGCDSDFGPGGFVEALGFETQPVVIFDVARDPREPLGLNLGVTDLFLSLRDDITGLRDVVSALAANFDPGDLTVPFDAHL
jgi:hypothetical protein